LRRVNAQARGRRQTGFLREARKVSNEKPICAASAEASPKHTSKSVELASFLLTALRAVIDFCRRKRRPGQAEQQAQAEASDAPAVKPHPIDEGVLTKIAPFPIQDG
jgi:hypothetical protein